MADNGVVHVIDAVLLPPSLTVVDIIVNSPDHETLETAVIAAELVETLNGEGPFTIFAPTDQAFSNLPAGVLDDLLQDPTGELAQILLYHAVAGENLAASLTDGQVIETINGKTVTISIENGVVKVNNATVTFTDLMADMEWFMLLMLCYFQPLSVQKKLK